MATQRLESGRSRRLKLGLGDKSKTNILCPGSISPIRSLWCSPGTVLVKKWICLFTLFSTFFSENKAHLIVCPFFEGLSSLPPNNDRRRHKRRTFVNELLIDSAEKLAIPENLDRADEFYNRPDDQLTAKSFYDFVEVFNVLLHFTL